MLIDRVLIDTDPGLGLKYYDVDDGLALFLMLNNPKFEIEGITAVFGNTPVQKGFPLIRQYLKITNKTSIPHKMGASKKEDLGRQNGATSFLIEKVKDNPGELTLLTLGPFTNVATALMHYPDFLDDLKLVVMMGGTISPLSIFNPRFKCIDRRFYDKIKLNQLVAEFNCLKDPFATKKFLEAKTKTQRVQMGLEACCRTVIGEEHVKKIEAVKKPVPQFIARNIKFWLKMWKPISSRGGFFPFDTCVPIYLLSPGLFKNMNFHVNVDTAKVPGKLTPYKSKKRNSNQIKYCYDFINPAAREEFMEIFISNLSR